MAALLLAPSARAAQRAETQRERVSHSMRSAAAELAASVSALEDMLAGYAGGSFPDEVRREGLRAEVLERANGLWELRGEFWDLDDQVRLAQGAEAIGRLLGGQPAAAQARAVLDSEGAQDLGEWTRVLCDQARKGLDREEAAHAAARARRRAARLSLWACVLLSGAAGAALAALARRRPAAGVPAPNC